MTKKSAVLFFLTLLVLFFASDIMLPYYESNVVFDLRVPRSISILITGFLLSFSGYIIQMITRNNLADPFITGSSSGSMLGVILCMIYGISFYSFAYFLIVVLLSFVVTMISIAVSRISKLSSSLLLGGIAVNSVVLSLIVLGIIFSKEKSLSFIHISFGSFNYHRYDTVIYSFIISFFCFFILFFMMKDIKIISFHEEKSKTLGINTKLIFITSVIICSIMTSVAVSLSGIIGFVGLMAPHISRIIFASFSSEIIFLMSGVLGSVFLLFSSIISRLFFYPVEIPPGVFSSISAAVFFIYSALKGKYSHDIR